MLAFELTWGQWRSKLEANNIHKESPELFPDLVYIWEGFLALTLTRQMGCPIQFSEIESWLNLNSILDMDSRQEAAHLIRVLDTEYIKFFREQK